MAGTQTLTVGGDTVTLGPRYGYEEPTDTRITHRRTLGGTVYSYIWHVSDSFDLPVNNISAADKVFLETWREAATDITYAPDFDVAPGTTITVRITNIRNPIRMMNVNGFNTTGLYEGVLTLRKTTAN